MTQSQRIAAVFNAASETQLTPRDVDLILSIAKDEKAFEGNKDTLRSILNWFEAAKPNPTIDDACVQIGCHYEEVGEMGDALSDSAILNDEIKIASDNYKGKHRLYISHLSSIVEQKTDLPELLDAMCDQIVTAVGVCYMLGFDVLVALEDVDESNWSKFEDGKPVFDENGKIKKGKNYRKAKPELYINKGA